MRRLLTWLLVTFGVAALVRKLRKRGASAAEPAATPPAPAISDHAEELRRKLAETRAEEARGAAETPEEPVEDRRAEVHAEARATIDEMRSSADDD